MTDSGYIQEGSGILRRAEVVKLMRISGSRAWESNVLSRKSGDSTSPMRDGHVPAVISNLALHSFPLSYRLGQRGSPLQLLLSQGEFRGKGYFRMSGGN